MRDCWTSARRILSRQRARDDFRRSEMYCAAQRHLDPAVEHSAGGQAAAPRDQHAECLHLRLNGNEAGEGGVDHQADREVN